MKKFILCGMLSISLYGCGYLRYRYDVALTNLPIGSKISMINNNYIQYTDTNSVIWRANYDSSGRIYSTIKY